MTTDRFRAYRDHDPVHWHAPSGAWLITRYADVVALLNDPCLTSRTLGPTIDKLFGLDKVERATLEEFFGRWLSLSDGDHHRQLRRLIAPVLAPPRITPWAPHLNALASRLAAIADSVRFEDTFARPYAAAVVGAVLGLTDDETGRALVATAKMLRVLTSTQVPTEHAREAVGALAELAALADGASQRPAEGTRPTPLLAGMGLPEDLLVATFVQLIAGAYDPLARCLTTYVQEAGAAPVDLEVVDEVIRRYGPFELLPRVVGASTGAGGRSFEPGSRVLLAIGSANHDETRFTDPLALKPDRPTRHLAFGGGRHRCPAASLAHLAVTAGIRALAVPGQDVGSGEPG